MSQQPRNTGAAHAPSVTITPSKVNGRVALEITGDDSVDYIWLLDAESGDVVSGRKLQATEPKIISILVGRGKQLVPLVHTADGVWAGGAFTAQLA